MVLTCAGNCNLDEQLLDLSNEVGKKGAAYSQWTNSG